MPQDQSLANCKENKSKAAKEWLTVYALPFFYGAITRLPFIYFVIHMRFSFELSWHDIGFYVGSYQALRCVTSATIILAPRTAHFLGTLVALLGYAVVLLSDKGENQTRVIWGTILVGGGETFAAMQTFVKKLFGADMGKLESSLRMQYAAVTVGVTVAFSLGGALYQNFGISGVSLFGVILAGCEILVLFLFFLLDNIAANEESERTSLVKAGSFSSTEEPICADSDEQVSIENQQDCGRIPPVAHFPDVILPSPEENPSIECVCFDDDMAPDYEHSIRKLSGSITQALDRFSESGAAATYMSYTLCLTFSLQAITIGYNLAISPVYILEVFDRNTTQIGVMLAAGSAFGAFLSLSIGVSTRGSAWMEQWLPSPFDFLGALLVISLSILTAAIPFFPIHIVGLLLVVGVNDVAALLLNEMQGAITSTKAYATLGPLGQVIRRSGNVVTALTGPVLFAIFPQLPYIVAGSITLLWTITLAFIFRHSIRSNRQLLANNGVHPKVLEVYDKVNFARKEVLVRQVKKGQIECDRSFELGSSSSWGSRTSTSSDDSEELPTCWKP